METIEHKLDKTIAVTNQNWDHIQTLQEQLDIALYRIDDLEKTSRRYNIRIRGLPEPITKVPGSSTGCNQKPDPKYPPTPSELDRAHGEP